MYKQASHRILKNRTLKRRVTSHHYNPKRTRCDDYEYATLRAHQTALTKLKHKPELIMAVMRHLESKQLEAPSDPHLAKWRQMLDDLVRGECTIEMVSETVMGYDEQAKQLRETSVLICLVD